MTPPPPTNGAPERGVSAPGPPHSEAGGGTATGHTLHTLQGNTKRKKGPAAGTGAAASLGRTVGCTGGGAQEVRPHEAPTLAHPMALVQCVVLIKGLSDG